MDTRTSLALHPIEEAIATIRRCAESIIAIPADDSFATLYDTLDDYFIMPQSTVNRWTTGITAEAILGDIIDGALIAYTDVDLAVYMNEFTGFVATHHSNIADEHNERDGGDESCRCVSCSYWD